MTHQSEVPQTETKHRAEVSMSVGVVIARADRTGRPDVAVVNEEKPNVARAENAKVKSIANIGIGDQELVLVLVPVVLVLVLVLVSVLRAPGRSVSPGDQRETKAAVAVSRWDLPLEEGS